MLNNNEIIQVSKKYAISAVEKKPEKVMNSIIENRVFNSVKAARSWANGLAQYLDEPGELEFLKFAIKQTSKIRVNLVGYLPLKTEKKWGTDTIVELTNLGNKIKIKIGEMSAEMAKMYNQRSIQQ